MRRIEIHLTRVVAAATDVLLVFCFLFIVFICFVFIVLYIIKQVCFDCFFCCCKVLLITNDYCNSDFYSMICIRSFNVSFNSQEYRECHFVKGKVSETAKLSTATVDV